MSTDAILELSAAPALDDENPWPGLLPFNERDQVYFRGRSRETEDLLRLVKRELLTVLFGLSGLGKSSLLQAGLFPVLRKESICPMLIRLDYQELELSLSKQVLDAVVAQAAAAEIEAPVRLDSDTLWEYFHRRDADFWTKRNQPVVPLLVFDQFEEIFTLGQKGRERTKATAAFIGELASLAEGKAPAAVERRFEEHPGETEQFSFNRHAYKILIVLREDYLPELEALSAHMMGIAQNRMRLMSMTGDAALEAVDQAPKIIDRDVAEKVVRFVAAGSDEVSLASLDVEPAILSLVCRELNARRGKSKITADLLKGKKDEVLQKFYEECFEGIAPEVRVYLEDKLLDVSGYRDSVALVNALATPGVTAEAIERLVKRRLIRIEDLNGERIELIHDRLTGVVRASKERREEEIKQQEATRLERERREKEEIAQTEQRAIEAAKRKRLFWTAVVLGAALIVSLIATWQAVAQARNAERKTKELEEAQKELKISIENERKATQDAQMNADEAKANAKLAKDKEVQANKSASAAKDSEAAEKRSAAEAKKNADEANRNAELAKEKTAEADKNKTEAETNFAEAQAAQKSAESARSVADDARRQAAARADFSQAAVLVEKARGDDVTPYKC